MNNELLIALLVLACVGLAAAFLITLAKLQEEKEKRWDETSRSVNIEKEKDAEIKRHDEEIKRHNEEWSDFLVKRENYWRETVKMAVKQRDALQDYKSSVICPHSEHFWVDGVCKRCGRMQDFG